MPCHHNLEEYLTAYLDGVSLRDDPSRYSARSGAAGEPRRSGWQTGMFMVSPNQLRVKARPHLADSSKPSAIRNPRPRPSGEEGAGRGPAQFLKRSLHHREWLTEWRPHTPR